jgi:hypothetical protein
MAHAFLSCIFNDIEGRIQSYQTILDVQQAILDGVSNARQE